jgi:GT2 family glycosyltransferase
VNELPASAPPLRVSVCVCTRNRVEELLTCLRSTARSTIPVAQVVVSDDGDSDLADLLAAEEIAVTYTRGPRAGLGANRNNAIAAATGSHLLFLDDDAELGEDFLATVAARLAELPPDPAARTIVTGAEINRGRTVEPNGLDIWGFQTRPYRPGQSLRTVVINATLFPRAVFERIQFDPSLAYGFEEVDFATRARAEGFEILPCFEATNLHHPSAAGRGEYSSLATASRLYVTLKRRRWTEGSRLRAWGGFGLGAVHHLLASVKRKGPAGVGEAGRAVAQARAYHARYRASNGLLDKGAAR